MSADMAMLGGECSPCCGSDFPQCYHSPGELAQALFGDFLWFRFKDNGANLLERQFRSTEYYTSKSLLCQLSSQPFPGYSSASSSYVFYRQSPASVSEFGPLFSYNLNTEWARMGTGLFVLVQITQGGLLRVRYGDIKPTTFSPIPSPNEWGLSGSTPPFLKTRYDRTFPLSAQLLQTKAIETDEFVLSRYDLPGTQIASKFGYSGNSGRIPSNVDGAGLTRIGHSNALPSVRVSPFDLLNQELTPLLDSGNNLSYSISADITVSGNHPSTLGWSETTIYPPGNGGYPQIIRGSRSGCWGTRQSACSDQIPYADPDGSWSSRPFLRGNNYLFLSLLHVYSRPNEPKRTIASVNSVVYEVSEAVTPDGRYEYTIRDTYDLRREAFELFSHTDLVPPFGFAGDTTSDAIAIDLWKRQYSPDSQGNIGDYTDTEVSDVGSLVVTFYEG